MQCLLSPRVLEFEGAGSLGVHLLNELHARQEELGDKRVVLVHLQVAPLDGTVHLPSTVGWEDGSDSEVGWEDRSDGEGGWEDRSDGEVGWEDRSDGEGGWEDRSDGEVGWEDRSDGEVGWEDRTDGEVGW